MARLTRRGADPVEASLSILGAADKTERSEVAKSRKLCDTEAGDYPSVPSDTQKYEDPPFGGSS